MEWKSALHRFLRQSSSPSLPVIRSAAEAGAMASMDGQLTMKTEFSGGFFSGLLKKFFGGESLFINLFSNQTSQPLHLVLTQS